MKYQPRKRAIEYEKALVEWWKKNRIFEKSVEQRPIDNSYVFYDGPPFITGLPHHGTLLSSIVKDAVPRFWTMRGKRVERRWGWDCHGLPAENFVEKQLGITDRREIGTKWSLEDYIIKARESMVANSETWEGTIERVGRWVDFKGAYRTMDKDFMESVWWAFKTLYEAGKIYEGRKVLMYDTKFATPVSKAEVTMDNDAYKEVTDPSAYVKFLIVPGQIVKSAKTSSISVKNVKTDSAKNGGVGTSTAKTDGVKIGEKTYLLAWTTTPWTLPANKALAVSKKMKYSGVKVENGDILILVETLVEKVLKDTEYEVVYKGIKGEDLVGLEYAPLIEKDEDENSQKSLAAEDSLKTLVAKGGSRKDLAAEEEGSLKVWAAEFVSDAEGTGIVHCAPAYGEDDYQLMLEHPEIGFSDVLDENGYYLPETAEKLHKLGVRDTDENGIEIWAGNKFIAKVLEAAGIIYKIEYIKHEYPFNPRSKQRIMYRAFPSWFFDIQGSKALMLEQNENINWFPGYLKHGRFAKNIEQAPDWNLSRDRFWATAMPVWKGSRGTVKVVGSYEELYELSGIRLEDYHRPWVDEIEFEIDGEHFTRVDKVLDCWFESGSMPFAQMHYPFENKEKFERNYPADFIVEYVGQVRAWFYYVHCVNTALAEVGAFGDIGDSDRAGADTTSDSKSTEARGAVGGEKGVSAGAGAGAGAKNAFKNVITTGTLAGNDGRKMSKSLGNYTDPNELMDKYSADSLRFLLLSSPVLAGEDFALLDKDVSDVARKLSMIWNVYDFFATYANVDGFEAESEGANAKTGDISVETKNNEAGVGSANAGNGSIDTLENELDIWIVSRVHQLRNEITEGMEEYNLPRAVSGILPFVDDLSNFFVRRSRRRFWKSEDDADKNEAYATLYYVLLYLSKIIAPFVPFLAEELYHNLTGLEGKDNSVHLLGWPEAGEINEKVLAQMAETREIISEGLALRMQKSEAEEQIKVRQPLGKFVYAGEKLPAAYEQMIADEVNVKKVEHGKKTELDKTITDVLRREGFARELIRVVQAARKKAGLSVDDRIKLYASSELDQASAELVATEVLATEFAYGKDTKNYAYDEIAKVNGEQVTISLEKA